MASSSDSLLSSPVESLDEGALFFSSNSSRIYNRLPFFRHHSSVSIFLFKVCSYLQNKRTEGKNIYRLAKITIRLKLGKNFFFRSTQRVEGLPAILHLFQDIASSLHFDGPRYLFIVGLQILHQTGPCTAVRITSFGSNMMY